MPEAEKRYPSSQPALALQPLCWGRPPQNAQHLVPVPGWGPELFGGARWYPQEAAGGTCLLGLPKPSCSHPQGLWSPRGGEKGFDSALPHRDMPLQLYGVGGSTPWHNGLALPAPRGLGWDGKEQSSEHGESK